MNLFADLAPICVGTKIQDLKAQWEIYRLNMKIHKKLQQLKNLPEVRTIITYLLTPVL